MGGAKNVAGFFSGSAQAARTALIDGAAGFVVVLAGETRFAVRATIGNGRITALDATSDPAEIAALEIVRLRP